MLSERRASGPRLVRMPTRSRTATRLARLFAGGSDGNANLTAAVAVLLLLLLAVEGVTLLRLTSLLTVHAFVGIVLIPLVLLKLASTGWRMLRYYLRSDEYLAKGPPQLVLRVLVAPVIVASTIALFATGVALLFLDETHGLLVGLHKASFVVWLGATSLHVLAHVWRLPALLRLRASGRGLRALLVGGAVVVGVGVALATLPQADRLQDRATRTLGVDAR